MDNLLIVAGQVGILFVLMAFGAASRWSRLITDQSIVSINNILGILVAPCLIVDVFQRPFDLGMLGGLGIAALLAVSMHLSMIAIGRCLFARGLATRTSVLKCACVFSNAGFMGIPLEQAILGDTGVFYGTVFIVAFNIFFWSYGVFTLKNDGRFNAMLYFNPGTVGIVVGLLGFLLPWKLPAVIHRPISLVASLNTPLAMLAMGYYLSGIRPGRVLRDGGAWLAMVVRLVVSPLLLLVAMYPLKSYMDPVMMLAVMIASSAPVGALVAIFAARYGDDVDLGAGVVSGSTLLSILTMPVMIALGMELLK